MLIFQNKMAKNIKIYIVTGVILNEGGSNNLVSELKFLTGYFTNLKELYKHFDKETIQSYSTICNHIRKNGFYTTKESRYLYLRNYENFKEIIIREVRTNHFYTAQKYISISEMLTKEISSIDLHMALKLSKY